MSTAQTITHFTNVRSQCPHTCSHACYWNRYLLTGRGSKLCRGAGGETALFGFFFFFLFFPNLLLQQLSKPLSSIMSNSCEHTELYKQNRCLGKQLCVREKTQQVIWKHLSSFYTPDIKNECGWRPNTPWDGFFLGLIVSFSLEHSPFNLLNTPCLPSLTVQPLPDTYTNRFK